MKLPDKDIIAAIRSGKKDILGQIYQTYRTEFIQWLIGTYNCPANEATELYQLSVVTLYDNIVSEKLTVLSSSLKSYLFAIGKNKWREQQRKSAKVLREEFLFAHLPATNTVAEKEKQESQLQLIERGLQQLGNPCKQLLEFFYYFEFSIREIMERMGYGTEASAKNAKYKCMQRLKAVVSTASAR